MVASQPPVDYSGILLSIQKIDIAVSTITEKMLKLDLNSNDINEIEKCVEFLRNESSQENKITSDQWMEIKAGLFDYDEHFIIEPASIGEYYGNVVDEIIFFIENKELVANNKSLIGILFMFCISPAKFISLLLQRR